MKYPLFLWHVSSGGGTIWYSSNSVLVTNSGLDDIIAVLLARFSTVSKG